MTEGFEGLVPDNVPDWLVKAVEKSGRNIEALEQFFNEQQVVEADKFDSRHYRAIREEATELYDLAVSRFADDQTWIDLVQDEYLALYKARPQVHTQDEMQTGYELNWSVMHRAMSLREWNELRTYTELDKWASAMAAVEFGSKLADMFDEMKEIREKRREAVEKALEALDKIRELSEEEEGDGGGDESSPEATSGQGDKPSPEMEKALDDLEAASQEVADAPQIDREQMSAAVKSAMHDTVGTMKSVENAVQGFGTDPGALQRMPAAERLKLAYRIQRNSKLRELAEKVGRFVRLAISEQARKIVHGSEELYDVTVGAEISRVLPSELALLANGDDTEVEFFRRFVENNLLEYALRGTEKVARGAIICMIDTSGSMNGARETWAKAVAIALLNIASREGRDFYGILFGSAYDELREYSFRKGLAGPHEVIQFAEEQFGGGTDFMKPLDRGMEVLRTQFNSEGAQKGDLVFITDGECAVNEDWLERYRLSKKELAFRTYSCLIGSRSKVLDAISDDVYNIRELAQASDVKDLFSFL